jgi:hypothetical protein
MKATFLKGVALGSVVSLTMLAATAAFAGTGVGKVFNLGETNRVNDRSQLEGATPSAVLNVTNSEKSASASGVSINVPSSDPPLVVNSATKVNNLNADLLDGQRASQFQGTTSKACTNGTAISSITPNGVAACNTSSVLPIDAQEAVGATGVATYAPSSMELVFQCVGEGANFSVLNLAPALASISYNITQRGGLATAVDNMDVVQGSALSVGSSQELVGQFVYYDQTTVSTVNISVVNRGSGDGCEYHGTVEVALK